ncbi:CDP-alcohol phosphatidyltransferase family protein [Altericroceibacterium spongiae]|uniref:CDP-alcohol phosphatidyltransferase family protein n=1 Tax=Altericroceibacterium spongiae TaxID=2320269 RepID=A0A420EQQ2_9SPHN|nr:CDP-alcohol phosphatidyltransferase family protein [Altericroceibacterium spongiae]RKF23007.1 CDP-alcohol phosphatidyltransferase family protein [Altericroceibacterium spongiae]
MKDNDVIVPVGRNDTRLWGLTARERLERIADRQGCVLDHSPAPGGAVLVSLDYVFDPAWLTTIRSLPDTVLTFDGRPVLARCTSPQDVTRVQAIMEGRQPEEYGQLRAMAFEDADALTNDELRKRDRPFMGRLTPGNVRRLERASYYSAYKGVTDVLTKYLWPEWALVLTRLASRLGITPNMVTAIGAVLCVVATILFAKGLFWTGLLAGLVFMVLDTVDGKLARCTITSSKFGELFDHGIDLVHPPFWYWAWGVGLVSYGLPLSNTVFATIMGAILIGYVVQRLIEGAFIARFGMHIHVWRPFDSTFRLITARRNPNMVILFASLLLQRPDWGLVLVAIWTVLSLVVHLLQLLQAFAHSARGQQVTSWLT